MIELGQDDTMSHRSDPQVATLAMLRARFANTGHTLHETSDGFVVTRSQTRYCASIEELAAFGRQLGIA